MNNLRRHLAVLQENEQALVVASDAALERYRAVLDAFADRLVIHRADDGVPDAGPAIAVVVVLGMDNRESHRLYTACDPLKARGLPVVFGGDERGLTYERPNWRSVDLTILGMFHLATQYLAGLDRPGSYLEFGVFDGRTFTMACHALRGVCADFHAFDSFSGIVGSAGEEQRLYADGSYYANVETFEHNMRVAGCDDLPIHAVAGAFQDTLSTRSAQSYGIDGVSIVHIDSDIYEAAVLALDFVEPVLLDGALILFDEFHVFGADNGRGERRALAEWLARNDHLSVEVYRNYGSVARSYIVHRERVPEIGQVVG